MRLAPQCCCSPAPSFCPRSCLSTATSTGRGIVASSVEARRTVLGALGGYSIRSLCALRVTVTLRGVDPRALLCTGSGGALRGALSLGCSTSPSRSRFGPRWVRQVSFVCTSRPTATATARAADKNKQKTKSLPRSSDAGPLRPAPAPPPAVSDD